MTERYIGPSALDEVQGMVRGRDRGLRGAGEAEQFKIPNLDVLKPFFWMWYREHQNDVIYTVKVWIITKTLRWKDLRFAFERLFGPEPSAGGG